jgi:hypothetical protein
MMPHGSTPPATRAAALLLALAVLAVPVCSQGGLLTPLRITDMLIHGI